MNFSLEQGPARNPERGSKCKAWTVTSWDDINRKANYTTLHYSTGRGGFRLQGFGQGSGFGLESIHH